MPLTMDPLHRAGVAAVRGRPPQQVSLAPQQATVPHAADPTPVGIQGIAARRLAFPSPAATVGLRAVGAWPRRLQVGQRLVIVESVPGPLRLRVPTRDPSTLFRFARLTERSSMLGVGRADLPSRSHELEK